MSEFHVNVVQIGKVGKHPGADRLSLTQVNGQYTVAFTTGELATGSLAIHIPPDAIVDTRRAEFAWLAPKANEDGKYRVRATKIRGVLSHGFLVPAPADVEPGQNVQVLLGVEKYEPGPTGTLAGKYGDNPPANVSMPIYDIVGMRKYADVIEPGTEVVITEKIHGSNARFVFLGGKLYCGSRKHFRTDSIWNRMAEKYKLRDFLAANEGIAIYGEIYGKGVQDLTYGAEEASMVFFDAYDTRNGKWLPWDQFRSVCEYQGLPLVPILYRGPYSAGDAALLAEGPTVLGNGVHVREGIVVKPTREAWNETIGRVFLKLPGEGYLTRKEKKS